METNRPSSTIRVGSYDVFAKLGGGGMGEIYLARQTGPADFLRPVVLKVIRENLADDDQYRRMFLDEARLTATIAHPNVVHVLDFGEQDDVLYMAMEYLDGESLATTMRRLVRRGVQMPAPIIAHILAEVCAGLHAAHNVTTVDGTALHLVHRDVSPANIFMTFEGTVKVLDFGVARAEERLAESRAGRFGKMAYMSPEQIADDGTVDRRSDIFSLGIVLYELCTLRRLFRRKTHREIAQAILNESIPLPSEVADGVPLQLDLICQKCLARDPNDRYQSALELRRDLLDLRHVLAAPGRAPEEAIASFLQTLFEDRQQAKAQLQSDLQDLRLTGPLVGRLPTTTGSSSNGLIDERSLTAQAPEAKLPADPKTLDSWFFRSSAASSAAPVGSPNAYTRIVFGLVVLFGLGAGLATWSRTQRRPPVPNIVPPAVVPTIEGPAAPVPTRSPPAAATAERSPSAATAERRSGTAESTAARAPGAPGWPRSANRTPAATANPPPAPSGEHAPTRPAALGAASSAADSADSADSANSANSADEGAGKTTAPLTPTTGQEAATDKRRPSKGRRASRPKTSVRKASAAGKRSRTKRPRKVKPSRAAPVRQSAKKAPAPVPKRPASGPSSRPSRYRRFK